MDLRTNYLGLDLAHPIMPSASPLSKGLDKIKRLEDAGASAITIYSLFEEQIDQESHQLDHFLEFGTESFAEALSYFPDLGSYNVGPDEYLNLIGDAKQKTSIPIIGSRNGVSDGGWTRYAKLIQEAGADALELNVYYIPTDPKLTSADVEDLYIDVVKAVRAEVSIPLAVKVGPYFSSPANVMNRIVEAGANGLVLFNRFYQPDFDLEALEVVPRVVLSTSEALRLPLRWVAILHKQVKADIAATTGIHTSEDVLKMVMAGATRLGLSGSLAVVKGRKA